MLNRSSPGDYEMDPRYLGGSLMGRNEIESDRHRPWTKAEEDTYYQRHTPTESRLLRIASVVAGVSFGFMTMDFWQQ